MIDFEKNNKRILGGFTLVEVLVSVLILTSGMLVISAVQTKSLSFNQAAYFNNAANVIGYDMLGRIRSNPVIAVNGAGYKAVLGSIPKSYPDNCVKADCTPAQLASYDINQWKFIINERLPDGDGTISMVKTGKRRVYTITIFFDDSKGTLPGRSVVIRVEV